MQQPTGNSFDEITRTTTLYVETYIALELLHCTYDHYVQTTSRQERLLCQFYVMLKSAKERWLREEAERKDEANREQPSDILQWG